MMRRWARVFAPLFLLLLTAGTTSGNEQILFVKGRIAEAEYLEGFPLAGGNRGAPFVDGGNYRTKIAITEILIGQSRKPDLYLTLTITDAPQDDPHPEIFLLIKQQPGGQIEPVDWDYAADGVCTDPIIAQSLGIADAIKKIQKKYPCKS